MSSAWDGLLNNEQITELPHYAVNQSLPEDSFFTDRVVAKKCLSAFESVCKRRRINLADKIFVEPAAGEGCFYHLLPPNRKLALDINPLDPQIKQADFLSWYPQKPAKYVVIGNPPFGVRGAMALAFVNRALLFADIVAFILPMSFFSNGKGSNMKRVRGAALVHNEELPSKSFYLPSNDRASVAVKTVFQVWIKGAKQEVFTDYDVSEYVDIYTCCSVPERFCGLGRGRDYDCFLASSFYKEIKLVKEFKDVLYGSGYGFIIKKHKREIMRALQNANWLDYCSAATNNCRHIRMYHIRKFLGELGYGEAS